MAASFFYNKIQNNVLSMCSHRISTHELGCDTVQQLILSSAVPGPGLAVAIALCTRCSKEEEEEEAGTV